MINNETRISIDRRSFVSQPGPTSSFSFQPPQVYGEPQQLPEQQAQSGAEPLGQQTQSRTEPLASLVPSVSEPPAVEQPAATAAPTSMSVQPAPGTIHEPGTTTATPEELAEAEALVRKQPFIKRWWTYTKRAIKKAGHMTYHKQNKKRYYCGMTLGEWRTFCGVSFLLKLTCFSSSPRSTCA